jgi:hypothetical protein
MPMQSMLYPQNRISYPSRMISQPLHRYSRFDSHPVALTQSGLTQKGHEDIAQPVTHLPSIAPETGASKRFSFFD